ncbi:alanine--tRNA ligase [Patescibacteria group bacterium]|nr:MAG: alanine--tRNA ligase [Patescibacteria group bacterium]
MTAQELRETYLSFFEAQGHKRISSASLIPENDPTVLFTTAGMHPLVPYLLGELHPQGRRLTSVQKCVRTGDIDEVGDDTHLTFFEMLGNWSLQDYFKQEAIEWSFLFLTRELGISIDRLAVSVFAGDENAPFDEEAYRLWLHQGISEKRIAKLGKKDNWWGPAGQTGPCGPDTEMFYWVSDEPAPEVFDPKDRRWVEIWNDVFMQYNKREDGTFEKLEKPNVDTGMGLERTLAVLNGKQSVFDTELFEPIFQKLHLHSDAIQRPRYGRIIVDHVRAAVMIIADGMIPSNKDQGYVLRRLLRRALRTYKQVAGDPAFFVSIAESAVETLRESYPALLQQKTTILEEINKEQERFSQSLEKGEREVLKRWERNKSISGVDAFNLYQTYGFPLELTEEIAREYGQEIDHDSFAAEFKKHQELSRVGSGQKFAGGLADTSEATVKLHTATHMLHQALRSILGSHVEQKGSNITPERLRFDFSHPEKMTQEQVQAVEALVNENIKKDLSVQFQLLTLAEAKARGAIGLFEDKYATLGDKIKVYFIGDEATGEYYSKEVCGGPHVERTGLLGRFKILKEEAVAGGVRRIKANLE